MIGAESRCDAIEKEEARNLRTRFENGLQLRFEKLERRRREKGEL